MQLAVDATALAIVREPTTLNAREIQQRGEQYLASALRTDVSATLTSVTVTREGRSVKVAAAATMDRTILKVMGRDPMPIGATSQASSARKLEVALVLDNTYSMSERLDDGTEKMIALKKQAKKVLDSLQTLDAQPGRGRDSVKVSIVPFDTEVRLDTAKFRNENWFEWLNGANASNWTGYVYDRPGNYAASDGLPTGARDSYFPAPRESECSSGGAMNCPSSADLPVIQPLTSIANSRSRLDAVIRDMQPRGFTNIAIGTVWGQATLSRSQPFSEGAEAGDDSVQKVMLVLTDGLNTAHHVDGKIEKSTDPKSAIVARIDANTRAACDNAKRGGIEIFTIRVLDGDEGLLRSCASSAANYSSVKTESDMNAAFDKFLEKITQTRITH
jgi:hypothetical protein